MRSRWLLVLLATQVVVLPLLLAAVPPPQTKGLRTLRLNAFTPDAATIAARARGFLAAEGLDFELTITPNSTVQMRGLADGTWDIGFTAADNVLAWSGREGTEFVVVAQPETGPTLSIYAPPEIQSYADLRGRPLAADAVDTGFALVLRRILLEHGLDLDRGDYELVAVGGSGARLQSMQRGETFAGVVNPQSEPQAQAAGLRRLGDHRAVVPDYPGNVMVVSRPWAQANRDVLVRYLRAWLAGARWVAANREATIDLVAADQGISREAAARVVELASDGMLSLPGFASVLDLRTRFGFQPPIGTDLARFYDLSYFLAARGQ